MHDKWVALDVDLDGCVFNQKYREESAKGNLSAVIDANKDFFDKLLKIIKEKSPKKLFLLLFSNRQFKAEDKKNAENYKTELAVEVMPKIYQYICEQLKDSGIACVLDGYLLTHLFMDQEASGVFEFPEVNRSNCYFDHSKFITAYTHLHRMASQQSAVNLDYYIIDDSKTILDGIEKINSDYFPEGSTSYLYYYAGDLPLLKKEISGSGKVDKDYKENVKKICESTLNLNSDAQKKKEGAITEVNVVQELIKHESMDVLFQKSHEKYEAELDDTVSGGDDDDDEEKESDDDVGSVLPEEEEKQVISDVSRKRKTPSDFFWPPDKKPKIDISIVSTSTPQNGSGANTLGNPSGT